MICCRCDGELSFISTENTPNGNIVLEYLCEKCLCFYQEIYNRDILICSIWGDLSHGRN